MARTAAHPKKTTPPTHGKALVKNPWLNNSVRRRWTRITYVLLVIVGALFALGNPAKPTQEQGTLLHWIFLVIGFLAVPLLYPVARRFGTSRTTALWAMAILAANVPWLLHLRHCDFCALAPVLSLLMIFWYQLTLDEHPWGWVWMGLGGVALVIAHPLAALGVVIGLAAHAGCWVRGRNAWMRLGLALLVMVLGSAVILHTLGTSTQLSLRAMLTLPALLGEVIFVNPWLLLALPLLWMALFSDPAARWQPNREISLLGLVVLGIIVAASLDARFVHLHALITLAPLAALWLAMGLARLQARAPVLAWMPVAAMLVLATLPWNLIPGITAERLAAQRMPYPLLTAHNRLVGRIVPLYAYIRHELTGDLRNIDGVQEMLPTDDAEPNQP